jgi:hypothetical protein
LLEKAPPVHGVIIVFSVAVQAFPPALRYGEAAVPPDCGTMQALRQAQGVLRTALAYLELPRPTPPRPVGRPVRGHPLRFRFAGRLR